MNFFVNDEVAVLQQPPLADQRDLTDVPLQAMGGVGKAFGKTSLGKDEGDGQEQNKEI